MFRRLLDAPSWFSTFPVLLGIGWDFNGTLPLTKCYIIRRCEIRENFCQSGLVFSLMTPFLQKLLMSEDVLLHSNCRYDVLNLQRIFRKFSRTYTLRNTLGFTLMQGKFLSSEVVERSVLFCSIIG